MIGRGEITRTAQRNGVDAQTVERDYVLAHVAAAIGQTGEEHLILKGGTCLRLVHYPGYRYSADLDYSVQAAATTAALTLIQDALHLCSERAGLPLLRLVEENKAFRIEYVGPLGAKVRTIKLDLVDDELVLEHIDMPVSVSWRDLPEDARISAYTLTEICAEKLRCVVQRRQCRDVYDLWALLEDRGGADLFEAWHRFVQKAEHRGLDPRGFFRRWDEGLDWYGARWNAELDGYLGPARPDFAAVSRTLARRVSELRAYVK